MKCAFRAKGFDINKSKPEYHADRWNKDNGMAMFILTSAMDLKQIALVENCETALEVMTKLESFYEQKSELNKMMVHERFYQYKMNPSDSIAQHIAKVECLAKQLKESGEEISNTAIMTKMVSTLPTKYRSLRQTWMSLDPSRQTIVNLTARLLDEEASLNVEEENETALLVAKQYQRRNATGKPRTLSNKEGNTNKADSNKDYQQHHFSCYNCGRRGHFAKECPATKKSRVEKNMLAFNINSDWHDAKSGKWILDSGASAHVI